ncbi:MAG: lipoyl(octanoyl) transferase LipB [Bacteroidales bacterium]|nr:lipoyl(octanoyl) transferase LipB [Bacteroidales bacterium]MDZ4204257.1 lipoyl(octanoyl) transferase LipB [Bacteroidales bacterium]
MNQYPANKRVEFQDLGLIAYKEAWDYQEKLFGAITELKKQIGAGTSQELITPNYLLFCEHNHVYTLGKSGSAQNLLVDNLQLKAKEAEFFRINRGGDITYHGPGQIIGYPILNLEYFVNGIKEYIFKLEEPIIRLLYEYGIVANRLEGATGVWLDVGSGSVRKICAIGVRTSRWVSMHGFALNVNTHLDYFNYINPCGFTDKAVTSMQKELGVEQDIDIVKTKLKKHIADIFGMELVNEVPV